MSTTMCSIWGSRSVPSGLDGSGRSPTVRMRVVVDVVEPSVAVAVAVEPDLDEEQAASDQAAAAAPELIRKERLDMPMALMLPPFALPAS